MVFTGTEATVALHSFVNGLSCCRTAVVAGINKGNVSRARRRILAVLKTLGVNTDSPRDVSDAVAAILRRQKSLAA